MVKAGFEVTLIAPNTFEQKKEGVNIIPIDLPNSRIKRMLVVTFKMYKLALRQKSKIYHFHDPELMLCGILLRLSGKKIIFDIHENVRLTILDKPYLSKPIRKILYYLYLVYEKIGCLFYNKLVLALSEETFEQYYTLKESLPLINFPLKIKAVNNKTFNDNIVRFVYVGVVHEYRGIFEMLELSKLLTDNRVNIHFDIVGTIRPESLKQELCKIIINEKLEDKIILRGFVDATEITSYLQKADFGISLLKPYKRYKEALPTKIFEYMQHGLPVITNDFPLYKEYVEDTETGICVNIDNIKGMVFEIEQLLKNKGQLKKMSENGIKVTQNKYNWLSQETKLIELYNEMLRH